MDVKLLYKEKKAINHQFPTVTVLNDPPTIYEGLIRCEKGKVKELADQGVWPFTEYVKWHKFRLELPSEYPIKPPVAIWLTQIPHPNIVPNVPGAVCVSVLGEAWNPTLRLASVINALYYLLSDPNPNNVFDHPECLKAAAVCRRYGFPTMGGKEKERKAEKLEFNVIPIPEAQKQPAGSEVLRFRVLDRRFQNGS